MLEYVTEPKDDKCLEDFLIKITSIIQGDTIMSIADQLRKSGKIKLAKSMLKKDCDIIKEQNSLKKI